MKNIVHVFVFRNICICKSNTYHVFDPKSEFQNIINSLPGNCFNPSIISCLLGCMLTLSSHIHSPNITSDKN